MSDNWSQAACYRKIRRNGSFIQPHAKRGQFYLTSTASLHGCKTCIVPAIQLEKLSKSHAFAGCNTNRAAGPVRSVDFSRRRMPAANAYAIPRLRPDLAHIKPTRGPHRVLVLRGRRPHFPERNASCPFCTSPESQACFSNRASRGKPCDTL